MNTDKGFKESEFVEFISQIGDRNNSLGIELLRDWYEFKRQKSKDTSLIEKDYEILSFIFTKGNVDLLLPKVADRFTNGFNYFTLNEMTNDTNAKINSVRRLRDNIIFSLGDKEKYIGEIKRFKIIDNIQSGWVVGLHLVGKQDYHCLISTAEKVVEPIPVLITEDGKNVYEGDKWVSVQKGTFDILTDCVYQMTYPASWLFFSTIEAADEYILMNKPVLSLNDLLSVWDITRDKTLEKDKEYYKETPLFSKFERLAKELINSSK